ncbi:MAG: PmoA family protein [Bacteroidota bacterium]|nr:PmoA family protein [Bacteroidota bacterium]
MKVLKKSLSLFSLMFAASFINAQKMETIHIVNNKEKKEVVVTVNNKPFTSLLYSDTLYKPFLYPVYAPDGAVVTRGYPMQPRAGEPTDHPHHSGIWFNYENVNGLDFWNNSFAIPAAKKKGYGSIKNVQVLSADHNRITYSADWIDFDKNVLLTETTSLIFEVHGHDYIIDRITTLSAKQDVAFNDAKDGLLGMRVTKELQIPTMESKTFKDDKGIVTTVKAVKDPSINGTYITSEGKEGDNAWATRGNWCLLYGRKQNDMISIAMIDHPKNIGYPTYWHARGYGLFAANPLGQKIFSNGKEELNFHLAKGNTATFRYRIVIASGKDRLSNEAINKLAAAFAKD